MKRHEIENRFKWKIEDIFASNEEFYLGLENLKDKISFKEFSNVCESSAFATT